jgi:hypothetical protein
MAAGGGGGAKSDAILAALTDEETALAIDNPIKFRALLGQKGLPTKQIDKVITQTIQARGVQARAEGQALNREKFERLPDQDRRDIADLDVAASNLASVRDRIKKIEPGLVRKAQEFVLGKIGEVPEELQGLSSDLAAMQLAYQRAMSGLTVTEREMLMNERVLPQIGDGMEMFVSKLESAVARIKRERTVKLENAAKAGYNVGNYVETPAGRKIGGAAGAAGGLSPEEEAEWRELEAKYGKQ